MHPNTHVPPSWQWSLPSLWPHHLGQPGACITKLLVSLSLQFVKYPSLFTPTRIFQALFSLFLSSPFTISQALWLTLYPSSPDKDDSQPAQSSSSRPIPREKAGFHWVFQKQLAVRPTVKPGFHSVPKGSCGKQTPHFLAPCINSTQQTYHPSLSPHGLWECPWLLCLPM